MFVVQTAINADRVSAHETEAEAIQAIRELFEAGLAERGEFNVVELGENRRVIRAFDVDDQVAPAAAATGT
ncbi:MAG: hypothetical protein ACR2M2_02185 [Gaiellaceae bacterium]